MTIRKVMPGFREPFSDKEPALDGIFIAVDGSNEAYFKSSIVLVSICPAAVIL